MKLYELPRDKGIKIRAQTTNNEGKVLGDIITFHHIDGMYSYCTVDGMEAPHNVCHLSANQELSLGEDGIYNLA